MRVFLAGATGVIGRRLVPMLLQRGHAVAAMTRAHHKLVGLSAAGAQGVLGNALSKEHVRAAMDQARPDVVISQLSSIPHRITVRHLGKTLEETNRLRVEGTQILLEAARMAGAKLFLAQSSALVYAPGDPMPANEDDPLYASAPEPFAEVVGAVKGLEETIARMPPVVGVALRYGCLYGPGTMFAPDGSIAEAARRGRLAIIGEGTGRMSFIHVDDAAEATLLAMHHAVPGRYNIVDDDPAPLSDWLPAYAETIGAPAPRQLPQSVGAKIAGAYGTYLAVEQRGAANDRARRRFGWAPRRASWRDGFRHEFATLHRE